MAAFLLEIYGPSAGPDVAFFFRVKRSNHGQSSVGALLLLVGLLAAAPSLSLLGNAASNAIGGRLDGARGVSFLAPAIGSIAQAGVAGRLAHFARSLPDTLHGVPLHWSDEVRSHTPANWLAEAEAALATDPGLLARRTPQLGQALAELHARHPGLAFRGLLDDSGGEVLAAQTQIPIGYKELLRFAERTNAGRDGMLAKKVRTFGEYLDLKRGFAELSPRQIEELSAGLADGLQHRGLAHVSVRQLLGDSWSTPAPARLNERFAANLRAIVERTYERAGIPVPEGEGVALDVVHSGTQYNQQPWHKDYGLAIINFGNPGTLFDPQGVNRIDSIAGLDDVEQALPWTLTVVKPRTQHAAPASRASRRVMVLSFEGGPGIKFRDFRRP